MTRKQALVVLAAALAMAVALAAPARADVYYEVGPGQTYATIQAALIATPFGAPFTQNHVINVHAGTYAGFNTDFQSRLNGQPSRTSLDKRLIIQAVPGDDVTVTGASAVRESHVTVQGMKFTGITNNPNGYYILQNYYSEGRGGLIVQNNEFVGAQPLRPRNPNTEVPEFTFALVNNYVHDFNMHYMDAGNSGPAKQLVAGNLYARSGNLGGTSIYYLDPLTSADEARYCVNNTVYTESNLGGLVRTSTGTDQSMVTFSNNVIVTKSASKQYGLMLHPADTMTPAPTMENNLQFGNAFHYWARGYVSGGAVEQKTIAQFNAYYAGRGQEVNGLEVDPLFVSEAGSDFRLQELSPAANAGDVSIWNAAIADLGIGGLLASYWNPVRDIGYDRGQTDVMGALVALRPAEDDAIPEPASVVLVVLGAAAVIRRRRRSA